MKELLLLLSNAGGIDPIVRWTAFGAIGQWMCAIATFLAVLVALKPYRRKLDVGLISIGIALEGEKQVIPLSVRITNTGQKPITIKEIGISENQYKTVFQNEFSIIPEESQCSFPVSPQTLQDNLMHKEICFFRIYVCDTLGRYYYTSKFNKAAFTENTMLAELSK